MKKSVLIISILFAFLSSAFAQKEVVIIGTMHRVSGLAKNAYRPMLKKAKAYQPEAIYVERIPAWDTLSMKYYYARFLARVDTLRHSLKVDANAVQTAMQKPLSGLTKEDCELLKDHYTLALDYANMGYYGKLMKHGVEGMKTAKAYGHENTDISIKLAVEMGIKELFSMDNQRHFREYGKAWRECDKDDKTGKDKGAKRLKKEMLGLSIGEGLHGALGDYGKYTNTQKITEEYHRINSFRYRETSCKPCEDGMKYWDLRNQAMAQNIGNQIRNNDYTRNVVVVGAGHVVGLQEVLEREFPDIKVRLYREL